MWCVRRTCCSLLIMKQWQMKIIIQINGNFFFLGVKMFYIYILREYIIMTEWQLPLFCLLELGFSLITFSMKQAIFFPCLNVLFAITDCTKLNIATNSVSCLINFCSQMKLRKFKPCLLHITSPKTFTLLKLLC